jgi:hypothetical protein
MKTLFFGVLLNLYFLIVFCEAQILINYITKLRKHKLYFSILRKYQSLYKYPAFELLQKIEF